MVEKVYNKDHKENKALFSDLKVTKKYSLYCNELDKAFGDKTYEQFYKDLVINKKIRSNNFKKLFEKQPEKGGIVRIEEPFDIKTFTICLKKMKQRQEEYEKRLKNPHPINLSPYKEYKKSIRKGNEAIKINLPEIPDIGKYNPSYDALRKHSFHPCFCSVDFKSYNTFRNENNNISSSDRVNTETGNTNVKSALMNSGYLTSIKTNYLPTSPNKCNKNYETNFYKKINNNKKAINNSFSTNEKNIEKNFTSSFGENNHCLNFDSYTKRIPMIKKSIYNTNVDITDTVPSYCLPKYCRGNVDFNKVSSNFKIKSYFEQISKSNTNPPLGLYQPKYDYVSKKTVDVFLDKKPARPKKQVQFKKIIFDYDKPSEYLIAPSLNEINGGIEFNDITK